MTTFANAEPTKRFFIEMLIRDITLEDAILDLIDNAVDSLCRLKQIDVSEKMLRETHMLDDITQLPLINIQITKDEFKIEDKCGGIDFESAKNEIFRFGKVLSSEQASLSVYGIGLKRAIFKLGRKIEIQSKTINSGFIVKIDVDEWIKEPDDWRFSIEEVNGASSSEEAGTIIIVQNLNEEILFRLNDGRFESNFNRLVSSAYPLFLDKHLRIHFNNIPIKPQMFPMGKSEKVKPAFKKFEYENVSITFFVGLSERIGGEWNTERAGWYVICNGRVVVFADKTQLTGWGDGSAQFVGKYRGFLGIAFFFSSNPEKLPWTTTKRGLNRESKVFQYAKGQMNIYSRPVLNFLNKMYSSGELEEPAERDVAEKIKSTELYDLASAEESSFKVSLERKRKKDTSSAIVRYKAQIKDLEKVRKALEKPDWSNSDIGKYALEYLIKQECTE